ncbi:MAG: hypothetical protein MUF45_02015 [Spirosomaceae bacterium]|nr:hypothetical protein [Spirosomataceae bacterium]
MITKFFIILSTIGFFCKTHAISISHSKQKPHERNIEKISFENTGVFGANNYFSGWLSDSAIILTPQNNLATSVTDATNIAQQIKFTNNQLTLNGTDYFVPKHNSALSNWYLGNLDSILKCNKI